MYRTGFVAVEDFRRALSLMGLSLTYSDFERLVELLSGHNAGADMNSAHTLGTVPYRDFLGFVCADDEAAVVALLEGHSAYQAIGEPARQRLFAAFVAKLAEKKERRSHKKSKKRKKDSKRRRESRDSDDDNDSGCAAPLVIVLHKIHNPLVGAQG